MLLVLLLDAFGIPSLLQKGSSQQHKKQINTTGQKLK
jgi:hypothetical protein